MEENQILIDEKFLPAAQELITSARRSICISTFKAEITSKPRGRKLYNFFTRLSVKAKSGVVIRFLISKPEQRGHIPIGNGYAISWLQKNGIKVRHLKDNRVCHGKILIVDDYIAILGSHNLSVKSCHNNFEVSYMFQTKFCINKLAEVFDRIWENSQKPDQI